MESHSPNKTQPTVAEIFEKCLGCKWTLHVLGQVRQGVLRPGALERSAAGLTAKVLNERLVKLTRYGILEKHSYPEIPSPSRVPPHAVWIAIRRNRRSN